MDNALIYKWIPVENWRGRYKDEETGILGYRPSECRLISVSDDPKRIRPYQCKYCSEHAVFRHKYLLCAAHNDKRLAKKK